jgi:hypothetical protein
MRWHILVTLLHKEALRHLANRGGLALTGLLIVAAAVLGFAGNGQGLTGTLSGSVQCCFIDYWQDGPWIEYLRQNVPPELAQRVKFRPVANVAAAGATIYYPASAGAIQVRGEGAGAPGSPCKVWVWYPGTNASALAVFEAWFWKESARYFRQQAAQPEGTSFIAALEDERSSLQGTADAGATATTALMLFALFFTCVYLLPSYACEERERGLLLAQVLSPASHLEIQAARAVFYAALGMGLAVLVAGIGSPAALGRGLFWLALLVAALGAVGVGLTIASLARTQRLASLGALGYTLAVALLLAACQAGGVPGVPWLALEYHGPRLLHAALSGTVAPPHWAHLAAAAGLAIGWVALATGLFRRQEWQ